MTFSGIPLLSALWLFCGFSAAAIIIYLLRYRKRGKEISSTLIWERVVGAKRSIFKDLLGLLVQIFIILLICLALTEPGTSPAKRLRRNVALIVDSSASMAARSGKTTRIEEARARARTVIAALGTGDRAMVVSAGDETSPLTTFDAGQGEMGRALEGIAPSGGGGALREAVDYAANSLSHLESAKAAENRILLITDHLLEPAIENLPADIKLSQAIVGEPAQNLAVTAFDVRRNFNLTPGYEVLIGLANFGSSAVDANLALQTETHLVGRAPIHLDARKAMQKVYTLPFGVEGKLSAKLSDIRFAQGEDSLAMDNDAFAAVPHQKRVRTLLVTRADPFLKQVFAINPQVILQVIGPEQYSQAAADSSDLVVLDRFTPGAVPRTNAVYVNPSGAGSPFKIAEHVDKPAFSGWAADHPLLQNVALRDLQLKEADVFAPEAGDATLLGHMDGPLILARKQANRMLLAFGFDLTASDFPLRTAFPVLFHNLVSWLAEPAGETGGGLVYKVGDRVTLAAGDSAAPYKIKSPDGGVKELEPVAGRVSFRPRVPGFYSLERAGAAQDLAVSFLLPDESDLMVGAGQKQKEEGLSMLEEQENARAFWPALILLALAMLAIDWILYHHGRLS